MKNVIVFHESPGLYMPSSEISHGYIQTKKLILADKEIIHTSQMALLSNLIQENYRTVIAFADTEYPFIELIPGRKIGHMVIGPAYDLLKMYEYGYIKEHIGTMPEDLKYKNFNDLMEKNIV